MTTMYSLAKKQVVCVVGCLLTVMLQLAVIQLLEANPSRLVYWLGAFAWTMLFFMWVYFFILGVSALKECFRKTRSERQWTQPFTASEVRRQASTFARGRVNDMLHAYADRLEADEKAVPVGWQVQLENGEWEPTRDPVFHRCNKGRKVRPIFTHPATADAERLAEALREQSNQMRMVESYVADGAVQPTTMQWADKIITAVGNKIAAHSAQTRPPAASVPDAHWFRARAWLSDESLGYDRWKADMYSLGKGTHESYILVIGEIPALGKHLKECENPLAAQENPNG